jgi:DNA-binding transcriptional LysR family regulator
MTSLREIDLNLLISLKTLLDKKSVTESADILDMTQSGMSRNLSRLREIFADDLLVRVGNTMVLTPFSENLVTEIDPLLIELENLFSPKDFLPSTVKATIRIAANDYFTQLIFPKIANRLFQQVPNIKFEFVAWNESTLKNLEGGVIDFAFGGLSHAPPGVYQKVLARQEFVAVVAQEHPEFLESDSITLDQYCRLNHISMTLEGRGGNPIDEFLKEKNLSRNVAITTPYFISAFALVAETELLMVTSSLLVNNVKGVFPIKRLKLLMEFDIAPFSLFWHHRHKNSPLHMWFKDYFFDTYSEILTALEL